MDQNRQDNTHLSTFAKQIKDRHRSNGIIKKPLVRKSPSGIKPKTLSSRKPNALARSPQRIATSKPVTKRKPTQKIIAQKISIKQPIKPQTQPETPNHEEQHPQSQPKQQPAQTSANTLSSEQLYAMAKMGYTQWEYGKLDRARAIFQTLISQRPNEVWFRCALGSIYQKQKQYGPALQEYSMALELDPNDIPSRVNRGEIFLKVGKKEEGKRDLMSAMRADLSGQHPSSLRAKALLTTCHRQLQRQLQ